MFGTFNFRKMDTQEPTPTDRKRNRDRRAQQRLRIKRLQHIEDLESQVAHCNEHHGGRDGTIPDAKDAKIQMQELELTALREDAQKLSQLVDSMFQAASDTKQFMASRDPRDPMALCTMLNGGTAAMTPESAPQTESLMSTDSSSFVYQASCGPAGSFLDGLHGIRSRHSKSPRLSTTNHVDSQYVESGLRAPALATEDAICLNDNTYQDLPTQLSSTLTRPQSMPVDDSISHSDHESEYSCSNSGISAQHDAPDTAAAFSQTSNVHQVWQPHSSQGHRKNSTTRPQGMPQSITVPSATARLSRIKAVFPWISNVEDIAKLPSLPKPVEILFGSRDNTFTNDLHKVLRGWRVAEAERLANGWLVYVYVKWMVDQSEASFALVPPFLHPVPLQLEPDSTFGFELGMIYWPMLRVNLMEKSRLDSSFDFGEIKDALSCCAKVRWPWGKELLYTDNKGNLQIEPEFFSTFTSLQGWGLTREFLNTYPNCFMGMDMESILFTIS